jgi:hypothetical protein
MAIHKDGKRVFCHDLGRECDFKPVPGTIVEQCPGCGGLRHPWYKNAHSVVKVVTS